MKKRFFICFLFIFICIISASCSAVGYGENMLNNGSFSNGLSGWTKVSQDKASAETSSGFYTESSYPNEIVFNYVTIKNTSNIRTALAQRVRVERGQTYMFSVRLEVTETISGDGDFGAYAGVKEVGTKNICVGADFSRLSPRYSLTSGRIQYYFYVTVENVDHITIELRCVGSGAVRFLDASLTKIKLDESHQSYSRIVSIKENINVDKPINSLAFLFVVFFALLFVVGGFIAYEYIAKELKKSDRIAKKAAAAKQETKTSAVPATLEPAHPPTETEFIETNTEAGEGAVVEIEPAQTGEPVQTAQAADTDGSDEPVQTAQAAQAAQAPAESKGIEAETASVTAGGAVKQVPEKTAGQKRLKLTREFSILLAVLAGIFVIKVVFAGLVYKNNGIYQAFTGYASDIVNNGFASFYTSNYLNGLAPGYVYILGLLGLITKNMAHGSFMQMIAFALPSIIADICSSILLFRILERGLKNSRVALVGSIFYACNIALFVNSVWFGQFDSILAALLLLTLYMVLVRKYWHSAFAYAAAVLFKAQAIFVLPVIAAYLVISFIKRPAERRTIGLSAAAGLFAWFLLTIPLSVNQIGGGNVFYIFSNYLDALKLNKMTYNAFSIFGVFGYQNSAVGNPVLANWLIGTMIVLLASFLIVLFVRYKGKGNIILVLCAYLLEAIYTFSINMREFFAFAAVILLVASSLLLRDRRLFFIAVAYTVLDFICGAGLMLMGADAYPMDSILMVVGSSASVLLFVYFTMTLLDITVQNNIKPIQNYTHIFR